MSGKVGGKSKSGKAAGGKAIGTSQSCSAKVALQFRVDCIHCLLKKGNYAQHVGAGCTQYATRFFLSQFCTDSFKKVYLAAILEYLSAESLELVDNAAHDNKKIYTPHLA